MNNHLTRKVRFEGTPKLDPCWKVTTSYLQGKYEVEIRIESVNKDNSHSWVRISHGLNKLVTDLSDKEYDDNEQETSETQTEVFALKTEVFAFASRSKAKAKPRRPASACSSTRTVPICERSWTDIEPGTQSNQAYPVAKRLNTLLRHGQLLREEDGAIEFWRLKDYLRNEFEHSQDIGCAINLHSFTNSGLIAGGLNSSREGQTVFTTAVNPMDKDHKDPHELDLTKPRLASYTQR